MNEMNCSIYHTLNYTVNEIAFSYESAIEMALHEICKKRPEILKNREKTKHYIQQQHNSFSTPKSENHLITFEENPIAFFSVSMDYMFGVVSYSDIIYFD